MKPDGRALDIAAIGLGQAGGNLAAEFYRRGYRAIALNTAQTDLAALEPGGLVPALPPERRLYVGLDGYDGAGSDPAYGRECIRAHADRIKAQAQKLGHDADAVIICAGLGGGTGSALSTLVEILEDEDLPLIALMTLPSESESGLAKVNAIRSVNDVVDANLLGWIFADNGRLAAINRNVSFADYYATVNDQVIAPLDALNQLNARNNIRPIRTFDGEDFRKLLLAGGVINYATAAVDRLSVEEVVDTVKFCIQDSDLMPGFDITRMSYLGLILEAPAAALADTTFATFEEIHDALKTETNGAAIYQGAYRTDDHSPVVVRVLAVTQSLPQRIRQLLADAKREGQVIGSKVREDLPMLELGEIQEFDLFRTNARPTERPRRPRAGRESRPSLDELPMEVNRRSDRLGDLLNDMSARRPRRRTLTSEPSEAPAPRRTQPRPERVTRDFDPAQPPDFEPAERGDRRASTRAGDPPACEPR